MRSGIKGARTAQGEPVVRPSPLADTARQGRLGGAFDAFCDSSRIPYAFAMSTDAGTGAALACVVETDSPDRNASTESRDEEDRWEVD
jgi:hypothetical protein